MIYAILEEYRVIAHDANKENLITTVKTFMPKYENRKIAEIEDVEIGYDGYTYVKGHAPIPNKELAQKLYREYRNQLLKQSDEWGVADRPQTEDVISHKEWRQYLREYTEQDNWWLQKPLTYKEWSEK